MGIPHYESEFVILSFPASTKHCMIAMINIWHIFDCSSNEAKSPQRKIGNILRVVPDFSFAQKRVTQVFSGLLPFFTGDVHGLFHFLLIHVENKKIHDII